MSALVAMLQDAANDGADPDDIRAGFVILRRMHLSRLAAVRAYVRGVILWQSACVAVCAFVGVSAWLVSTTEGEPGRSVMQACAALNAATILLTLRQATRDLREAFAEARAVRALLAEVDANAAAYEASRMAHRVALAPNPDER